MIATATAIRGTFLYLITNPRVLTKLRVEVESISPPISNPITDSEAKRLPYLPAIIKEGLRLNPPVAGLMEKKCHQEATLSTEYLFREAPASAFQPGRLGEIPKSGEMMQNCFGQNGGFKVLWRRSEQEQILGVIFAVGKWQCLGQNIAQMELNKVFVEVCTLHPVCCGYALDTLQLLRHFNFSVVDPARPWRSTLLWSLSVI